MKLFFALLALLTIGSAAQAATCPATVPIKDGASATQQMAMADDGSGAGSCQPKVSMPDGALVTLGAIGDPAWPGTGNGTVDAVLKAIYAAIIRPVGSPVVPLISAVNASSLVVAGSAKTLLGFCAHVGATPGWVFAVNSTSAPSNGAVTMGTASGNVEDVLEVAANTTACKSFGPGPGNTYSVGITLVYSSTAPASGLTLSATAVLEGRAY